tara:strand:- start:1172 stop:1309 length:138 start_codon:yes stop_codon:yes gene_type:complete
VRDQRFNVARVSTGILPMDKWIDSRTTMDLANERDTITKENDFDV